MEFGLSFLPVVKPNKFSAEIYFENVLNLAKFADQVGFKTIKMTEHYLHAYGGYCPSPLIFLASVASITQQIRLMTGCILPVFHHPIQIAAETAMLDAISAGRLDVGFARAYLPYEFDAFGIDMDSSRLRFEETISAVKKLWTEEKIKISTPFFNIKEAQSFPKPTQTPHPPLWGAAVYSRQSFAWLGEQGFNLLVTPPLTSMNVLRENIQIYKESFVPNSVTHKPKVAISIPLLMRENQQEAEKAGDYYLSEYLDVWIEATHSWNSISSSNYPGYTGMSSVLKKNTPEKMRHTNQAIIGSPAIVLEKTKEIVGLIHLDQILWQIDFGGQDYTSMQETLSLFANNIMSNHEKTILN